MKRASTSMRMALVATALMLIAAACGGAADDTTTTDPSGATTTAASGATTTQAPATTAAPPEPATVTYWHTMSDPETAQLDNVIAAFEAVNPTITIEPTRFAYDDFKAAL